jgi:hypothetical protein
LTVALDADHALTIKGTPSTFACSASDAEVAAPDDTGLFHCSASAFDFLAVAGVELEATNGAISLDELHANDAAASVVNELTDEKGFVHD